MSSAREEGVCYNPRCNEPVEWKDNIHESYCSWVCAVEAREGGPRQFTEDADNRKESGR